MNFEDFSFKSFSGYYQFKKELLVTINEPTTIGVLQGFILRLFGFLLLSSLSNRISFDGSKTMHILKMPTFLFFY